ncbi:hypothetical protein ACXYTP_18655 [Tsukamurella ocularis]|uniref:hypothetical protein n=1 Tax=Tsukamurella ocularis TaxID=1970234 RepID=UPI0039EF6970
MRKLSPVIVRPYRWAGDQRRRAVAFVSESHLRQWLAFVVLAGICEVLIVVVLNIVGPESFDWGNVPTWIGANLTAATLSLALVISIGDRQDRKADKDFEESERRDRAKRQARLIHVEVRNRTVSITNFSDSPIFRLHARVDKLNFADSSFRALRDTVLAPEQPHTQVLDAGGTHHVYSLASTPEDMEIEKFRKRTKIERMMYDNMPGTAVPRIELRFVDADGRKWFARHLVTGEGEPWIKQEFEIDR